MTALSALPDAARRAAWERLWARLLAQPPQNDPEPEIESELAGAPDVQRHRGDPTRQDRLQERRPARKEVTAQRSI